ncbi:hypothetical protein SK803_45620 [Lentzea sp. BCCO 10_0856]|uniref:Uncharacterized protein n=1 Tax=Lentzea miocenica TaxID=3095431 RepID=A0ABU4TH53_9PSEU|nr:hypothetical protein [Lentzea sp. BCCO 10_0856]MDX8037521.1 hypothetical protein [Lentzea sp. BCCO 10_0856]
MTDPQNPAPNPDNVPGQTPYPPDPGYGSLPGAYEVTAVGHVGQPMPQEPNPWANPGTPQWPAAQPPPGNHGAEFVQYQVAPVNNLGFAMPPLAPVLPQEMAPARPSTITTAMWIWIAAAVLSIALGPVLMLTNMDYLIAQDSAADTADGRRAAELGFQVTAVVAGFAMLVAAAPYIAFAVVLRNGHNWARILLTILGMIGLVVMVALTLVGLQAPAWQAGVTISIVVMGLTVAAVVLQFLPASNKYVR